MSGLSAFLKQNVKQVENVKVVVSDRFNDENGKPIEWELKALTARDTEAISNACTKITPGKGGTFDSNKYQAMLIAESVVYPNLNNAELQDSYGVKTAETLLQEMLYSGEYAVLNLKVQEINGLNKTFNDLVKEAKN